ncbi:hypothetical protein J7J00_26115 [Bacillus sp. ISL-4]|uniref:hypothetical protein n=1 Tax=Bacillus sp. ISL-4 TaxID=2819125 RepID=UPI001BE967BD|nr:hypothetical protein [Bacillus sp. ISL-4]MBT2668879.1 hypothetical protein [Bacillus sp. ISL-4]MBT2675941.1 hypothetical protein [Streptomyces sp. ISL-14]
MYKIKNTKGVKYAFSYYCWFYTPWILGIYLFRNQPRLFITFYPIGVAVASLINEIGFNFFWKIDKDFQELSLPSIPYDLGIYPI